MNLSFKKISQTILLVIMFCLLIHPNVTAKICRYNEITLLPVQDSLLTESFLKQSFSISMRELLAANLAVEKGNSTKVKSMGKNMVDKLSKVNEEIRSLAKIKKVTLPMSTPDGGQRPDGRVDSAPENMRDTSRIKNAGGEAGNTGQSAKNSNEISQADVSNSIDKLRGLSGTAFDKAYLEMIEADKIQATSLLQKASKSTDKDIKAFANKYLPLLRNNRSI